MQTNQFLLKKSIWLLPLAIAAFSLLSISSCKKEKAPKGSCISLSQSKIKKAWADYIKSGEIDYLMFVTCYNPINHEINVSVQAYKKDHKLIGPSVELLTEGGCADLLPKLAVGENTEELAKLGILDESGRALKDFAYISLAPYSEDGYLAYKTNVVDKNDKPMYLYYVKTLPCPPCKNCKPPCPENCEPPCTPAELDSIKNAGGMFIIDNTKADTTKIQ